MFLLTPMLLDSFVIVKQGKNILTLCLWKAEVVGLGSISQIQKNKISRKDILFRSCN